MSIKMNVTRALLKLNKAKTVKMIEEKQQNSAFLTVKDAIELDERQVNAFVKKIALLGTYTKATKLGGVDCWELTCNRKYKYFRHSPRHNERVFLYIHGGGFCNGLALQGAYFMKAVMKRVGCKAITVEYSLSPENRYPTALNEIVECYKELITRFKPENVIVGGESAGGNLTMALLMYLRDNKLPLPRCALLASGYFDLCNTGNSYVDNESTDVSVTNRQTIYMSQAYVCGLTKIRMDHNLLVDPYVSPMYGDFKGLPPMFFSVCSDELLFDDTMTTYNKAKHAGVNCMLHINKNCFHAYMALGDFFKESKQVNDKAYEFVRQIFKSDKTKTKK